MTDNIVRAIHTDVNLEDFSFDAYELPSGEKRVGFAGASNVFGYEKNWLGRLPENGKKQLKGMKAIGYSGLPKEVEIVNEGVNITRANTISIRDFTKIAIYEVKEKGNPRAVVILGAMAETGLEKVIDMAFAKKSLSAILEKITHYTKWTKEEYYQALMDNREDVLGLILGNIR